MDNQIVLYDLVSKFGTLALIQGKLSIQSRKQLSIQISRSFLKINLGRRDEINRNENPINNYLPKYSKQIKGKKLFCK